MSRTPNIDAHDAGTAQDRQTPSHKFQPDLEINPFEFLQLLRRKRHLVAAVVGSVMLLTAAVMLLTPNLYRSHASILPSGGRDNLSGLMDLAGRFGVGNVAAPDENSSALYPSVLRSDPVRDGVLKRSYRLPSGEQREVVSLPDYFGTDDPGELRSSLSEITSISEDKKLGIIRLGVETTRPQLSQAILTEYLTQLEQYLRFKRRSQARDNESYLADQRATRGAELRRAEDSLQQFMKVNRNWSSSSDPRLQTELARMKREVELHAQTYLLLSQQLELARLEVQKDIPIVRVLDEPTLPTQKSGPRRTFSTVLAGCLALLGCALWLLVRDLWRQGTSVAAHDSQTGKPAGGSRLLSFLRRPLAAEHSRTADRAPIEHG